MSPANSGCRILAVVALYKQGPTESLTVGSFFNILRDNPHLAGHFCLVVYDNSPESHEVGGELPVHYVHDPANGGLAAAYNYALSRAEESGCEWLLLLDQDTTLTSEFLVELLQCSNTLEAANTIAAIVPKLIVGEVVQSPEESFFDHIRPPFSRAANSASVESTGVHQERMSAYNSGAALRVPVMRSLGGFPGEFWLDYLDHAIFHALYAAGYRVYVLRAVLKHDLSGGELNTLPIWRFRNMLKAQALFVQRAGSLGDRLRYRLWLLRSIRRLRTDCHDPRIWKETALQALLFNSHDSSAPVRPPTITPSTPS